MNRTLIFASVSSSDYVERGLSVELATEEQLPKIARRALPVSYLSQDKTRLLKNRRRRRKGKRKGRQRRGRQSRVPKQILLVARRQALRFPIENLERAVLGRGSVITDSLCMRAVIRSSHLLLSLKADAGVHPSRFPVEYQNIRIHIRSCECRAFYFF